MPTPRARQLPVVTAARFGTGAFNRRIRLRSLSGQSTQSAQSGQRPGERAVVQAELEDDFHHFEVRLTHDGEQVVDVSVTSIRYPWSTCPGAADPLRSLIGLPLSTSPSAAARFTNPRANCTHQFDIAALAVNHAAAGRHEREYTIMVPDRVEGASSVTVERDGEVVVHWNFELRGALGEVVSGPPPWSDLALRGGFIGWAERELDPDTAEAAIVARRAVEISQARPFDNDLSSAEKMATSPIMGTCHTLSVEVVLSGRREYRSALDFSGRRDLLLSPLPSP